MTAAMATTTRATNVASVAPALVSVTSVRGSTTGYWATPQPQMTAATPSAATARMLRTAGGEQGEVRQAADPGQHHQRQRPAGQTAEERGIGVLHLEQGRQREGPGHDGGALGAAGEVAAHGPVAALSGLDDQVDRGEKATRGDEHEPG